MDRVISLLAALVGLIALGGALLVHTNTETQRREIATEIAQLKTSMSLLGAPQPAVVNTPAAITTQAASEPHADDGVADALLALQDRIAALEQTTRDQSSQLEAARAQISSMPSTPPAAQVATTSSAPAASGLAPAQTITGQPAQSATASVLVADGPTKDCIPLGTRFMGQSGDSFPICKTKMVLKVAAVTDGLATINGPGDVAAGASVPYDKGCMLAVFSADTSGFAEMRVTCQ